MEFSLKPLCWYNSSYSFCYTYFLHTTLGNNGKNNSQKRLRDQDFALFLKEFWAHCVSLYLYLGRKLCKKNRNQGNVAFWHLVKVSAGIPSSMTHNICQKSLWDTRLENCLIWLKMSNETAAWLLLGKKK